MGRLLNKALLWKEWRQNRWLLLPLAVRDLYPDHRCDVIFWVDTMMGMYRGLYGSLFGSADPWSFKVTSAIKGLMVDESDGWGMGFNPLFPLAPVAVGLWGVLLIAREADAQYAGVFGGGTGQPAGDCGDQVFLRRDVHHRDDDRQSAVRPGDNAGCTSGIYLDGGPVLVRLLRFVPAEPLFTRLFDCRCHGKLGGLFGGGTSLFPASLVACGCDWIFRGAHGPSGFRFGADPEWA